MGHVLSKEPGHGNHVLAALRSGSWLTPERCRVYPAIVGFCLLAAILALVATSHAGLDAWNRPLGTDFSGVWVAGRAVLAGHPAQPYDRLLDAAAQSAAFGPHGYLPWFYPPTFLLPAALCALLAYLPALLLWQASTLSLYTFACLGVARGLLSRRALARRDVLVAALAFPAVAINVLHGHNGLLSAALLTGGVLALPRRPFLAGCLFGLLAYKPQLILALPIALLAGSHWRAIGGALLTASLGIMATLAFFGAAPWFGFLTGLGFARHVVLEGGGLESYKLQSAFAATRLLGGSITLAYAMQALVTICALSGVAWVWRSGADARLKLAGLVLASLLATPYALDYDMVLLGPALIALASEGIERGFPPFAATGLAFAWFCPLVARTGAMLTGVPFGLLTMIGLLALVMRQARRSRPCETLAIGPATAIPV